MKLSFGVGAAMLAGTANLAAAQGIQHDAEHYILLSQHGEAWATEEAVVDAKLAELRAANGGKPPNIVYVLIDDMGFGEFGMPELNKIRGGKTPNLDAFAEEAMTFTRYYAENICTPTRVSFMTGRYAVRTGMELTKVTPPEGVGLAGDEVTIAELLTEAGYTTHHIGKWHMGDIKESYPISQGFDWASFPMHNQVSYSFLTRDAEIQSRTTSFTPEGLDSDYALDKSFRLYDWVTLVDAYVGELLDEIDALGIADNTIVMVMGDNGPMKQEIPDSGYSEWLFRGTKGSALEGGHRVGAFLRWPGVIEGGSIAGDMVFVGDLYTTFARIAGNMDGIPTDRVVDGVDQTALLVNGDTHGRRDYIHLYEVNKLAATVKQNMKIRWPGPGVNPSLAEVYNLYWDPREEHPLKREGVWTGTPFSRMLTQHQRLKDKYPDRKPATGMPYEDVENIRPETVEMLELWQQTYGDARDVILGVEAAGN